MSGLIDWQSHLERLRGRLGTASDWASRETYAIDCARVLCQRLEEPQEAYELLIALGTERPSYRLALVISDVLLLKGDYQGAYDWSVEALALSEQSRVSTIRLRCAEIAMDYLSNRSEARMHLRAYFAEGGMDGNGLVRLKNLLSDEEFDEKIQVLEALVDSGGHEESQELYLRELICLCESSEVYWSKGIDLFREASSVFLEDQPVIEAVYRMAIRLDRVESVESFLGNHGKSLPGGRDFSNVDSQIEQNLYLSALEALLLQLVKGLDVNTIEAWSDGATVHLGARLVPILEVFADELAPNDQRAATRLRERALEIAFSDLDFDYFPTSVYQLLSDGLCGVPGAGELRIRAEQIGHRHPGLRAFALRLAAFEALRRQSVQKAVALFQDAEDFEPLDKAASYALRSIHWGACDHEKVRQRIELELANVPRESRRDLLIERAMLEESVGQLERAESDYREVVEIDRHWLPAAYGLGTLLDRQGRWRELASLVGDELSSNDGSEAGTLALMGRLAEIYEHHLDQLDQAADLYEQILRHKPTAPDAILGLARIYERQSRWSALVSLLESLGQIYDSECARANILFRAGEVAELRLKDLEVARRCYSGALSLSHDEVFELALLNVENQLGTRAKSSDAIEWEGTADPREVLVKRALTLSTNEALPSVEALLEQDPHPIWAWLFAQMSFELQRPVAFAKGLSLLAQRIDGVTDSVGIAAETLRVNWRTCSSEERRVLLGMISPNTEVGRSVFDLCLAYSRLTKDAVGTWQDFSNWWLSEVSDGDEAELCALVAYIASASTDGLSAAEEIFSRSLGESGRSWAHHRVVLASVPQMLPAARADALLKVASDYGNHPRAGVCAFEAGRCFEQAGHIGQAVQAYQLALTRDPDLVAAANSLIMLVGIGITPDSALSLIRAAAHLASTPAHKRALVGLCLESELLKDHRASIEVELLDEIAGTGVYAGFEQRLVEHYLETGSSSRAIPILDEVLEREEDRVLLGWAARCRGDLALRQGDLVLAVDLYRKSLGLDFSQEGQSGLAMSYLLQKEGDLARLAYRHLEAVAEPDDTTIRLEARLGQMAALSLMGRREAAQVLLTNLPHGRLSERIRSIVKLLDEPEANHVAGLFEEHGFHAQKITEETIERHAGAGWLRSSESQAGNSEQVTVAWQLQRNSWFQGVQLGTPDLMRRPLALNRKICERLLPRNIHPALLDSLMTFFVWNDPFGTDVSGPLAPLTSLENQRIKSLCTTLGVSEIELRLDAENSFRFDCKAGPKPCLVLGEGLFEMVSIDQLEFLVAWCLAVVRCGAMPAPFMRAARRFAGTQLVEMLNWIRDVSLGETLNQSHPWLGAEALKKQSINVIEWMAVYDSLDVAQLYEGLQDFGLHLACSLASSFSVPMETLRLLEMDDRVLDRLTSVQIRETVELSPTLRKADDFAKTDNCVEARTQFFSFENEHQ